MNILIDEVLGNGVHKWSGTSNERDWTLFCGDAEKERLSEFVRINETDYDFIKMPHHGRWNSSISQLISSVTPEYAVITCPALSADRKTTGVLDENGVETYYCAENSVTFVSDGINIGVLKD